MFKIKEYLNFITTMYYFIAKLAIKVRIVGGVTRHFQIQRSAMV